MSRTQANKVSSEWFAVKELDTKSFFNKVATMYFYGAYIVLL